jgi:hypothetical protein
VKTQPLFPVLCSLLLFPAPLLPQMPSAPGRLSVKSTPSGAVITIDNQEMRQHAPSTFAVSPGSHRVTAKDPSGKLLKCSPESPRVASGSTVQVDCTDKSGK